MVPCSNARTVSTLTCASPASFGYFQERPARAMRQVVGVSGRAFDGIPSPRSGVPRKPRKKAPAGVKQDLWADLWDSVKRSL